MPENKYKHLLSLTLLDLKVRGVLKNIQFF